MARSIHQPSHILTTFPYSRWTSSTSSRPQPLRARSCLGSSQRVHSYSILGSISTCVHAQDQGWYPAPHKAQSYFKDGAPLAQSLPQQPRPARLPWSSDIRQRCTGSRSCNWLSCSIGSWHASIAGPTYEPTHDHAQPPVLIWLSVCTIDAPFSLTQSLYALACRYACRFTWHRWKYVSKHQDHCSVRQ